MLHWIFSFAVVLHAYITRCEAKRHSLSTYDGLSMQFKQQLHVPHLRRSLAQLQGRNSSDVGVINSSGQYLESRNLSLGADSRESSTGVINSSGQYLESRNVSLGADDRRQSSMNPSWHENQPLIDDDPLRASKTTSHLAQLKLKLAAQKPKATDKEPDKPEEIADKEPEGKSPKSEVEPKTPNEELEAKINRLPKDGKEDCKFGIFCNFGRSGNQKEDAYINGFGCLFFIILYIVFVIYWQRKGGHSFSMIALCPCLGRFVPAAFHTVQDVDHLTLIVAWYLGILSIIKDVWNLYNDKCFTEDCRMEWTELVFHTPCTLYMYRTIGYYDDRLAHRRIELESRKIELSKSYAGLLSEVEDLLQAAGKANAGLVEHTFDSLKRDFLRFLEELKNCLERFVAIDTRAATTKGREALQNALRRFFAHWLKVFEQTSLSPQKQPRIGHPVTFHKILGKHNSLVLMVQALKEALEQEQVCFLAKDVAEFADMNEKAQRRPSVRISLENLNLEKHKNAAQLQEKAARKIGALFRGHKARKQVRASKEQLKPPAPTVNFENDIDICPPQSLQDAKKKKPKKFDWITFGGMGCGVDSPIMEAKHFPVIVTFACMRIKILSYEHLFLLWGIVVGIGVICCKSFIVVQVGLKQAFHVSWALAKYFSGVMYTGSLICLAANFRRIDIVMRLENEIREIDDEKHKVQEMRERIFVYYGERQALVDFWLQRTIPRLELIKELHNAIEDSFPMDVHGNDFKALHSVKSEAMKALDDLEGVLMQVLKVLDKLPIGVLTGDSHMATSADPDFPPKALADYVNEIQNHASEDLPQILKVIGENVPKLFLTSTNLDHGRGGSAGPTLVPSLSQFCSSSSDVSVSAHSGVKKEEFAPSVSDFLRPSPSERS